jgi:hypothetical protein
MVAVSVIIPTYNAGRFVCQAVDSVLAQTYRDYEIIVVDDGSTDDTRERLAPYGNQIRYVQTNNLERSAARNTGIRQARGELIAFLDADDIWLPEKLARQIAFWERNADLGLVYSWAQCIYEDARLPRLLGTDFADNVSLDVFPGLLLGKFVPTLTVVARAQCLHEVGLFDEQIVIAEDWDLWLRLALKYRFGCVPEILAYYRLNGAFLPAKVARHRAQDTRLSTVRKVCALAHLEPADRLPAGLESQAWARALWWGALVDYAVKNDLAARTRWEDAILYDPNFFFGKTGGWLESLIAQALSLYDYKTPENEAEAFVHHVFRNLPEAAGSLRGSYREALGRLKAGFGFRALEEGDRHMARFLMRRAVGVYPPLLRNLGIISICLR